MQYINVVCVCVCVLLLSRYTMVSGFAKLVSETNDLAGQRELISEYLQAEVLKPLGELAKMTQTERKRLMGEGAELHRSLKDTMETLDKVGGRCEQGVGQGDSLRILLLVGSNFSIFSD